MKKVWLLLLPLLLLCGCSHKSEEGGVSFYYLAAEVEIGSTSELFQTELRQMDETRPWKERVQLYLTGPVDENLRNPFPRNVTVRSATLREKEQVLELTLSQEYAQLTGIGRTLANACLTLTLTEYASVERIELHCDNGEDLMDGNSYLSRDLFESKAEQTNKEYICRIYFTDESQRYLIPALRKVVASENLPIYVLHQLLEGPTEEGYVATMPRDTRLLGFSLEDGIATVDLSGEFIENRPRMELAERMTIYSLVNSLTELDGIDRVQILVEGQAVDYYQYMRLPETLERCESAIGPVRTGINEFDATLYFGSWSTEFLAAAPTRIIRDDTRSQGEQIVRALLEAEPVNGLVNLMPEGTNLLSVDTIEGVCYIDLSKEFANIPGGFAAERLAVNALVASVCSIESISSVVLTIEGGSVTLPNFDLSETLRPLPSWFFPA